MQTPTLSLQSHLSSSSSSLSASLGGSSTRKVTVIQLGRGGNAGGSSAAGKERSGQRRLILNLLPGDRQGCSGLTQTTQDGRSAISTDCGPSVPCAQLLLSGMQLCAGSA